MDETLVIALDSLYIESRYPGEFGLLPEGKPTIKQSYLFFDFAKNVHTTIRSYLENKE